MNIKKANKINGRYQRLEKKIEIEQERRAIYKTREQESIQFDELI